MHDLKHVSGKNQLDSLQPGFVWEMGSVLTHGNAKYAPHNWKNGEPHHYVAALMRHVLQYMAGETFDYETGLPHTVFIACNAMFLHWHDDGGEVLFRACHCQVCTPTNGHSTATQLGS